MAGPDVGRQPLRRRRGHETREVDDAADVVLDRRVREVVCRLPVLGDEVGAGHAVDEVVDRLGTLDRSHHLVGVAHVHGDDRHDAPPWEAIGRPLAGEGGCHLVTPLDQEGDQSPSHIPAGPGDEHSHGPIETSGAQVGNENAARRGRPRRPRGIPGPNAVGLSSGSPAGRAGAPPLRGRRRLPSRGARAAVPAAGATRCRCWPGGAGGRRGRG